MKPRKLSPGDLVAIISPSNTIATAQRRDKLEKARRNFEAATGLRTVLAPNALAEHYYSAGTPKQRVDDFHWALTNPEVKGIIFSVGGSTAIELVDKLDYDLIAKHPKVIAGISNATTLETAILAKTGLITFLGVEFLDLASEPMPYEFAAMKQAWFDGEIGSISPNPHWHNFDNLPTQYDGWLPIRNGMAEGMIAGGNMTSFWELYGTEYAPDLSGCILVLESYRRSKANLHEVFYEMRLRGAFDKISGLISGFCIGSDDPNIYGNDRPMADLLLEVTDGYTFPIMQIGEIGHRIENLMLPIGARARLDATNKQFTILEPVAE